MGGFTVDGCGATDRFYTMRDLGIHVCPNCHKTAQFTVDEVKRKIDIFFIPTATISTKYAIMCKSCECGTYITEPEKDGLINGTMVASIGSDGIFVKKSDVGNGKAAKDPEKTSSGSKDQLRQDAPPSGASCPQCKAALQKNASFCWKCGYALKTGSDGTDRDPGTETDRADGTDVAFSLLVKDVFTITGKGTVVTGRVDHGMLHVGDTIEIVGLQNEKKTAVVDGIEKDRKLLQAANEGDEIGLLLRGISRHEVKCGQTIRKGGSSQLREPPDKKEMKTADDAVLTNSSDNSFNEEAQLTEPLTPANTTGLDCSFNNKRRAFSSPINLLPERKVCPKCNLLYVGTKEKCTICGCDLVEK